MQLPSGVPLNAAAVLAALGRMDRGPVPVSSSPPPPGMADWPELDEPDVEEGPPVVAAEPVEPACWWYRDFYVPHTPDTGIPSPCGDQATVESADWYCCLTRSHNQATEELADIDPGWRDTVWAFWQMQNAAFVDAHFTPDDFTACLAPEDVEPLWWKWDATDTGYTPHAASTPRAAVMQRALWLIASLEDGVPTRLNGMDVQDKILGPIISGDMSYRIYDTVRDGDELGTWFWARAANCYGPARQIFSGGPAMTVGLISLCPQGTQCEQSFDRYIMQDKPTFTWRYDDGQGNAITSILDAQSGNNHAWPKSTEQVWLCRLQVDRAAVMYDWFWSQAATHYREMLDAPAGRDDLVTGHYLAAVVNIRMALSVAARLAQTILHETGHNITLYHCANPFGPKAHCVQDIAMRAWWVYAAARLGLGNCDHRYDGTDFESSVAWDVDLGFPRRQATLGIVEPESSLPQGDSWRYSGWYFTEEIECEQGTEDFEEGAEKFQQTTVVVTAVATGIAFLFGGPAAAASVAELGAIIWGVEEVIEQVGTLPGKDYADLAFVLSQPMVPGGVVLSCCVYGRPERCSGAPNTPCWQEHFPTGYSQCCAPGAWEGEVSVVTD